jgi:hypothetical protein
MILGRASLWNVIFSLPLFELSGQPHLFGASQAPSHMLPDFALNTELCLCQTSIVPDATSEGYTPE